MAFKDTWVDKVDGQDYVQAEDINKIAGAIIDLEKDKKELQEQINGMATGIDPTAYGLPVLYLTGDTTAMTKDNAVNLSYVYGDRSGTASVKWQGGSSLSYPKKNYTIKFDNAFEAVEGWGEQKKYCLKANFIDHSHARNVVNAKLWGQIVKSRPASGGVTGAINMSGADISNRISISGNEITVANSVASMGYLFFTGQTFSAGSHVIKLELLNPNPADDNGGFAVFAAGVPGTQGTDFVTKNMNSVANLGTWKAESFTIEFPVDNSMIGITPYSFNNNTPPVNAYLFRNITVDGKPYVLEPEMPIPELMELPNGGAVDGFPCVVILNDEFHGLYTFNIPKDGWMFGMGDGEKEAVVCAETHSAATQFRAAALLDGSDFELEYVSDEANADWVLPSLNNLINAVVNSDGTDLDTTIAQYLDLQSAIDYYILVSLIRGGDMTDKNYILATYDGVKWFFSAYDMDSTYGLYWNGKSFDDTKGTPYIGGFYNRVMELIQTHKSAELKARYNALRTAAMSEDNLYMEFTNWAAKLPKPLLDEDVKKWRTIPSSAASNTAQILNWYRMRVALMDKKAENL